jgi:purine nucleosidase
MERLVIDTDPGVDDAHAIMLAFAHPNARVEALTTVAGNVGVDKTSANACTILDMLDVPREQTPVFIGADRALLGTQYDGSYFHGADGLGDSNYPPSPRPREREHAALALIRVANESPGELTLVAIAPLTNLALATRLDPELPRKFKRLVVMGGAIRGTGNNRLNPSAEFNVYVDPEAAAIVFQNWRGLWLLSWETTLQYLLNEKQLNELMNTRTPRGEFWARITKKSAGFVHQRLGFPGLYMPDPLAMAVALEPDIVTNSEFRNVTVELAGAHTRGQTTVDWFGFTGAEPNVNIVLAINLDRFYEMLRASVM